MFSYTSHSFLVSPIVSPLLIFNAHFMPSIAFLWTGNRSPLSGSFADPSERTSRPLSAFHLWLHQDTRVLVPPCCVSYMYFLTPRHSSLHCIKYSAVTSFRSHPHVARKTYPKSNSMGYVALVVLMSTPARFNIINVVINSRWMYKEALSC